MDLSVSIHFHSYFKDLTSYPKFIVHRYADNVILGYLYSVYVSGWPPRDNLNENSGMPSYTSVIDHSQNVSDVFS